MGSDLVISQEFTYTGQTDSRSITSAISVVDKIPEEVKARIEADGDTTDFESSKSTFIQIANNVGGTWEPAFKQPCETVDDWEVTSGEACGWTEVS